MAKYVIKQEEAAQRVPVELRKDSNGISLYVDDWAVATLQKEGTLLICGSIDEMSSHGMQLDEAGRIKLIKEAE